MHIARKSFLHKPYGWVVSFHRYALLMSHPVADVLKTPVNHLHRSVFHGSELPACLHVPRQGCKDLKCLTSSTAKRACFASLQMAYTATLDFRFLCQWLCMMSDAHAALAGCPSDLANNFLQAFFGNAQLFLQAIKDVRRKAVEVSGPEWKFRSKLGNA